MGNVDEDDIYSLYVSMTACKKEFDDPDLVESYESILIARIQNYLDSNNMESVTAKSPKGRHPGIAKKFLTLNHQGALLLQVGEVVSGGSINRNLDKQIS